MIIIYFFISIFLRYLIKYMKNWNINILLFKILIYHLLYSNIIISSSYFNNSLMNWRSNCLTHLKKKFLSIISSFFNVFSFFIYTQLSMIIRKMKTKFSLSFLISTIFPENEQFQSSKTQIILFAKTSTLSRTSWTSYISIII